MDIWKLPREFYVVKISNTIYFKNPEIPINMKLKPPNLCFFFNSSYAKQRLIWLHLIETVCRGVSALESLRPSTIVAVFLARCAIIFTRPDHLLYSSLGNYIMAKETPNFHIVPELLSMLHSTDVNHNAHRNFILEVIRDGLRTNQDLQVRNFSPR